MKWIHGQKWLMSFNPNKREIMIFSNRSVPENLDFSFNGKSVPITTSHKHLGHCMQSVPITTDVVSSNLDQGEVYNICDKVCQ